MSRGKPTSGGKTTSVKPSKNSTNNGARALGESTSPVNRGEKFNQTTTGSTGPKKK